MKKLILFFVINKKILLLFTLSAQIFPCLGQITEGYFHYSISVSAVDTSLDTRQKVGTLYNSKMELYFADKKSRIDFQMGKIYSMSLIVDNVIKFGLSLNATPNGKYAVPLYEKDLNAMPKKTTSTDSVILVNETKIFLGFTCKKAIVVQDGNQTIYWYTDEINIDKTGQMILNASIPGFPLYFSTIAEGMKMEYQVSNYKFELENKETIFSLLVPEGYQFINTGH